MYDRTDVTIVQGIGDTYYILVLNCFCVYVWGAALEGKCVYSCHTCCKTSEIPLLFKYSDNGAHVKTLSP